MIGGDGGTIGEVIGGTSVLGWMLVAEESESVVVEQPVRRKEELENVSLDKAYDNSMG